MENEQTVLAVEETAPVEETKPKTPKVKARTYDDLKELDPKKMTDKEKDLVIKELRTTVATLTTKNMQLDEACKSAFRKAKAFEDHADELRAAANLKLDLVKDNVRVFANNVMQILNH